MERLVAGSGKRRGKNLLLAFVIAFAAWFLGTQAGHLYGVFKKKLTTKSRAEMASEVISQLRDIRAGQRLADYAFEDIHGDRQQLTNLINDRTLVSVVSLSCESCVQELAMLADRARIPRRWRSSIVVSSANPIRLKQFADSLGIIFPVLWDEDRAFQASHKIDSYPINLLVDSGLMIEEVIAGSLSDSDFVQKR